MTRVLIADSQPKARHSLRALLTALCWNQIRGDEHTGDPIEIVGEANGGQHTIDLVEALHPDVLVTEIHMPAEDGLSTIRTIKRRWPEVRVVVLTMYATDRAAALESGADTYVLKGCPTSELLEAILPRSREE